MVTQAELLDRSKARFASPEGKPLTRVYQSPKRTEEGKQLQIGTLPLLTDEDLIAARGFTREDMRYWAHNLPSLPRGIYGVPLPFTLGVAKIIALTGAVVEKRVDRFDPELEGLTFERLKKDFSHSAATCGKSNPPIPHAGQLHRKLVAHLSPKLSVGNEQELPEKDEPETSSVIVPSATPEATQPLSKYVRPLNGQDSEDVQPLDPKRYGLPPTLTIPQFLSARSTDVKRLRLLVEELPDKDDLVVDLSEIPGGLGIIYVAAVISRQREEFHPDTTVVTAKDFRKAAISVSRTMEQRKARDLAAILHTSKSIVR